MLVHLSGAVHDRLQSPGNFAANLHTALAPLYRILNLLSGLLGGDGIAMHEKAPADLIITDLMMPEKEGIESIQEIRKRWPGTKIIAISGGLRGSSLDLLSAARMLGAARTLAEPFKQEEFLACVREVLAAPIARPRTNPESTGSIL